MAPRVAGTSVRRSNWRRALEVRSSRCTTCHQLSRATIDPAVSTKTSSRKTRRPRESVGPRITGRLRSTLSGWNDQGRAKLTETMVQAQLSDRRFGAEPVKVRAKVLAE